MASPDHLDPNDADAVHYLVAYGWMRMMIECELPALGRKTTDDWDKVTCRLCLLHRDIRAGR
jgi:hypothetical protein